MLTPWVNINYDRQTLRYTQRQIIITCHVICFILVGEGPQLVETHAQWHTLTKPKYRPNKNSVIDQSPNNKVDLYV